MPGVSLRDAVTADLDDLSAVEASSFASDRMTRASLRRLIGRESARLRVAVLGRGRGAILGYHLVLFRRGSSVARLYSIAVDRRARGAGVGRRLVVDAVAVAAAGGRRVLRLEVRRNNRRAIALYRSRGFDTVGERACYYADGADALVMEKPLLNRRKRSR